MERNEIQHDPRHLGVPTGESKMISKPMICSTKTVHLSCVKISTISKRTELSIEPRDLGATSGVSKMISKWYVWHKPCTYLTRTLTLSPKRKNEIPHEPRHLGVPSGSSKMISKPIVRSTQTYVASRLALSPKGPKRAFAWASSPSGTIRCIHNDFWAYGTSRANHAPILHWH
jgi:hypothetical protein